MASTRIALIARSDNTGVGHLSWDAFRHLKPHRTLVIDLSGMNGHKQYPERYTGNVRFHKGFLTKEAMDWITDDVDTLLTYEIPYGYHLYEVARRKGVKTVCQLNYEFCDHLNQKLPLPDVLGSPSTWHYDDLKKQFGDRVKMLLTPVDREKLQFRTIKKIKTFVHVAGVKLFEDRNGTNLLLRAIPLVKSKVKFIIYSQHHLEVTNNITDSRVELRDPVDNYWELYQEGDCLVLPRRYGGQSLQLSEAMSVGMIPIMLNCEPNNRILNKMVLVDTTGSKKIFTRTEIDCYDTEPRLLAEKIDQLAEMPPLTVSALNEYSDRYAESISWENRIHDYNDNLAS